MIQSFQLNDACLLPGVHETTSEFIQQRESSHAAISVERNITREQRWRHRVHLVL